MKTSVPFEALLRGGRFYVRGAEIYSAIENYILGTRGCADFASMKIRFNKFFKSSGELIIFEPQSVIDVRKDEIIGRFSFQENSDEFFTIALKENSPARIADSVNFENRLAEKSVVDGLNCCLEIDEDIPIIDAAVIATKKLVCDLHGQLEKELWIFSGIDLTKPLGKGPSALSVSQIIERDGMVKASIAVKDSNVGFIYFNKIALS